MRILFALTLFFASWAGAWAQNSNYRLEAGDTIEVTVWQEPKLNRQVLVRPDGLISFPLVGHVRVAGETLQSVERALTRRLQDKYTGDLDVTVLLVSTDEAQDDLVYVTGEVARPGAFPLKTPTTVMQAIALSGGFGPFAATGRVVVRRTVNGEDVALSFNYKDYESGKDASGNVRLRPGDVIIVPERGLFE